jgi:uncharacterized Fe-S cluster-containing radical SAM superfamily protein
MADTFDKKSLDKIAETSPEAAIVTLEALLRNTQEQLNFYKGMAEFYAEEIVKLQDAVANHDTNIDYLANFLDEMITKMRVAK